MLRFVAWGTVGLGVALAAIDLHAGLPTWWLLAEGPWVLLVGCLLVWLVGRTPSETEGAHSSRGAAEPAER